MTREEVIIGAEVLFQAEPYSARYRATVLRFHEDDPRYIKVMLINGRTKWCLACHLHPRGAGKRDAAGFTSNETMIYELVESRGLMRVGDLAHILRGMTKKEWTTGVLLVALRRGALRTRLRVRRMDGTDYVEKA